MVIQDNTKTGYYMVRAMGQTEKDFNIFFEGNVVAVGWSKVVFSKVEDPETLVEQVKKTYYSSTDYAPQFIGIKLNEVRRFKNIMPGDKIIVPYPSSIRLAHASNQQLYNTKYAGDDVDLANQRKVDYVRNEKNEIVTVSRSELSTRLQTRLRVRGSTVRDLFEFSTEIDDLFTECTKYSWGSLQQQELIEKFNKDLLRRIQEGRVKLKAGGIGLEKLISELLEIEGYKAHILPKSAFPSGADADIVATKVEWYGEELTLLIQVKHHYGQEGTWGAEQLIELREQAEKHYPGYKLVLVTTATHSPELLDLCQTRDISLISDEVLIEWIASLIHKLSDESLNKLGVSRIPQLINL